MEVYYKGDCEEETNVIYLITLREGRYRTKIHYIGLTKRPLKKRVEEHLYKNTSVTKYIEENDIRDVEVSILYQCPIGKIELETKETLAMCHYFLQKGTPRNQRNRLINKQLKGLEELTLNKIKEFVENYEKTIDNLCFYWYNNIVNKKGIDWNE